MSTTQHACLRLPRQRASHARNWNCLILHALRSCASASRETSSRRKAIEAFEPIYIIVVAGLRAQCHPLPSAVCRAPVETCILEGSNDISLGSAALLGAVA